MPVCLVTTQQTPVGATHLTISTYPVSHSSTVTAYIIQPVSMLSMWLFKLNSNDRPSHNYAQPKPLIWVLVHACICSAHPVFIVSHV
jgi:hypothetical protein